MNDWDFRTDVVVVGSGGGGMTAALFAHDLGARALVLEKSLCYGGSTSISGGSIWVPNNHLMPAEGIEDSREEALGYLETITAGRVALERLEAYVESIPRVVEYLEQHSWVHFTITPGYSDYYANVAGSKPDGGRTLEPLPLSLRRLGPMGQHLRDPGAQGLVWGKWAVTGQEAKDLLSASLSARLRSSYRFANYLFNPFRSFARRDTRLTLGNALIARLRRSLEDRQIPVWLATAAKGLVVEENHVVGIEAEQHGNRIRIRAEKGVILASGGFEKNPEMRAKHHMSSSCAAWSLGIPDNVGDGIRMGMEVGGSIENMDTAWWMPAIMIPGDSMPWYLKGSWWSNLALEEGADISWFLLVDRSLPGTIIVDSTGHRFTNEAAPYLDVVKAQLRRHREGYGAIPAFLIADQRYHLRYPLGPVMPRLPTRKYERNGLVMKAQALDELAKKCAIDPPGLLHEVAQYNRNACRGEDPDFRRGEEPIDRFYSDWAVKPNPCMAPIDRPPFYAIRVYPGDVGTNGGLRTDASARVLREDNSPIDGLYATGNCSASVMGDTYPGAGGTIGPAMAFASLAARHAVCGDGWVRGGRAP